MPLLKIYLPEIITVNKIVETFSSLGNRIIENWFYTNFHKESSATNRALTFENLSL